MHRRYKGSDREVVTKRFNYREVFGNQFCYHHQVDNSNNCRHSDIYVERNWETKYWADRYHAYFLTLKEVNVT